MFAVCAHWLLQHQGLEIVSNIISLHAFHQRKGATTAEGPA
jgi:hypothetical protein